MNKVISAVDSYNKSIFSPFDFHGIVEVRVEPNMYDNLLAITPSREIIDVVRFSCP